MYVISKKEKYQKEEEIFAAIFQSGNRHAYR
jgi:hypothetical protein